MQRVVPVPVQPAAQYVVHNDSTPLRYAVTMFDTLDVNYIDPLGNPQTFTESISGTVSRSISIKPHTDAVFTGSMGSVYIYLGTTYAAISNVISSATIQATNNLRVIDFRNADLLGGLGLQPNRVYVREIYTHPSNTYVTAMVTQLISETSVSDGILWLHASNPDAATMRAAAEAKGWTVYDL